MQVCILQGYTDIEARVKVYEKSPSFEDKVLVHVPDHSDVGSHGYRCRVTVGDTLLAIKRTLFILHRDFFYFRMVFCLYVSNLINLRLHELSSIDSISL